MCCVLLCYCSCTLFCHDVLCCDHTVSLCHVLQWVLWFVVGHMYCLIIIVITSFYFSNCFGCCVLCESCVCTDDPSDVCQEWQVSWLAQHNDHSTAITTWLAQHNEHNSITSTAWLTQHNTYMYGMYCTCVNIITSTTTRPAHHNDHNTTSTAWRANTT